MKAEYIIERQGKSFVLYEGLLDEAHRQGLCRISTTLIQVPHPDNGNMAIVAAEVETAKGTFSGIGDASPTNVGRPIVPHIVRMAETRAKARAMRDAVNIGVTALEELGDIDGETQAPQTERANGNKPARDRERYTPAQRDAMPDEAKAEAARAQAKVQEAIRSTERPGDAAQHGPLDRQIQARMLQMAQRDQMELTDIEERVLAAGGVTGSIKEQPLAIKRAALDWLTADLVPVPA